MWTHTQSAGLYFGKIEKIKKYNLPMFPLCAACKTCAAWREALRPGAVCGLSDKVGSSENKLLENGVGERGFADRVGVRAAWRVGCPST